MKILFTFLALFISAITFSQFCNDFNDKNISNWQGVKAHPNQVSTPGPSGNSSDYFLYARDASGYSYIYNNVDYKGDWREYDGKCLCWDFQVIKDAGYDGPVSPKMVIYSGSPSSPTVAATFTATVQAEEGKGWVHVCAPISVLNPGDALPQNANGAWTMAAGSTATDWNNLLQNVTGIRFVLDIINSPFEEYGYDNICIQDCDIVGEPTDDGAFCCDGENLVENGNFEYGNTGFSSEYVNDLAVYPGAYNVANDSSQFGTQIKDHSYCQDAKTYVNNTQFLLINGKTTQSSASTSVIWEQDVRIENDKNYKFCANFKNLPQCRFDILPEIQIEINGTMYPWQTINTSDDACDWYNISECFTGKGDIATIKIHLKEEGLGDGNDLAIDDIAVQQKLSQNLSLTVQHQGLPKQITGSVNSISTVDDFLLVNNECKELNEGNQYYWFAFELSSYPFTTLGNNMVPNTFAWSTNQGGYSEITGVLSSPWGLTTTFPDYVFDDNKLYLIGMYVPSCCESCYDEGWSYQLTLNSTAAKNQKSVGLSQVMKNEIKEMFKAFNVKNNTNDKLNESAENTALNIYPNPTSKKINLNKQVSSYVIHSVSGKNVLSNIIKTTSINISKLAVGMYILTTKDEKGKLENLKFVKK
ncbi:T9SS type A sorting domain-containing protein [Tenacibaculum aestuariivivum]|uniref:T9SS type A sorting domain-containing protein n=1 Tax=Tenacibaculum aestuariivivum TaxID=2006131 RepID=UPI003AB50D8D